MKGKLFWMIPIVLVCLIVVLVVLLLAPAPEENTQTVEWVESTPVKTGQGTAGAALPAPTFAVQNEDLPTAKITPAQTVMPALTPTLAPTLTPTPEPTPTPTPTPTPEPAKPLTGWVIGVDPGHQAHSNSEQEPVAPGSSETKKKVSSGTYGRFSGVREYVVNLDVALLLRDLLEEAGATVVMTRETSDVDISNVERAQLFNEKEVDIGVRIHCNGSEDTSVHGAFMLVPTKNPYKEDCELAARLVLDAYGEETGISISKGLTYRSDQTGFNWCERAVINIEMGHMTNEEEDYKLVDPDFQKKMARGIFNGLLDYAQAKADR